MEQFLIWFRKNHNLGKLNYYILRHIKLRLGYNFTNYDVNDSIESLVLMYGLNSKDGYENDWPDKIKTITLWKNKTKNLNSK